MLILQCVSKRRLSGVQNVYNQARYFSTKTKEKTDLMSEFRMRLPTLPPKKPKHEPFVKNFFMGKFDYDLFVYPEPQTPERFNEFQEWLKVLQSYMQTINPKEFESTNSIPGHVLQKLRELRVFGSKIPEEYGGLNLLNSEFMQVIETVSRVPSLGLFLTKHSLPTVDIINKYCSVEQKWKYLPKIAEGQSLASFAFTEKDSGPGLNNMKTKAIKSSCDKYWLLTGEKTFIANVNLADVFIVFCYVLESGELDARPETATAFLVDANTEGVSISKDYVETIGLKGFKSGRISLKNAKIPLENMIGEIGDGSKQLVDAFTNYRHVYSSINISILKNFLEVVAKDVLTRKHFDANCYELESTEKIISDIACSIYSMESVLYMTTSLQDMYIDQDVQLETAIVEQLCAEECLKRIEESIWLVGARTPLSVEPYEQIIRDAITLNTYETALIDTKIFTALLGLQHYGANMYELIKKLRNPLQYPKEIINKLFKTPKTLKLNLEEHLHPSLRECADFCDRSLYKLKESTNILLTREGLAIGNKHIDLQRLSEMVTLIYVYISIISRASRSYCIGNKNSEEEIKMCMILAYRLQKQVFSLAEDINLSEYANGDYVSREVAKKTFERKTYILPHALQRNY